MTHEPLRLFHVFVGSIGFITAPIALATPKGGRVHVLAGKIFAVAMSLASVTALWLAWQREELFFVIVAFFSGYLIWLGWRALYLYRKPTPNRLPDFVVQSLTLIAAIYVVTLGFQNRTGAAGTLGIVLMVFGAIGISLSFRELRRLISPPAKPGLTRIRIHATGMTAAYIAALSAFSANVLSPRILPFWISMLWPTVIITPILIVTLRRLYSEKQKDIG